ncbi:GNAT family N-acetyltransferase [Paenibacillus sp. PL91]|uniref:GNAT family N-acetyltransferase n=1 Tax=Paenibacillus sp. PL91 TaxID=2729538 RepID=UPI00145DCF6B|nr:GNAT family N-acetyltransferase [Paenibacillus sp. PL91]
MNWIEVEILWIEESLRGLGYGTHLLNQIERIAKEKGCTYTKLIPSASKLQHFI